MNMDTKNVATMSRQDVVQRMMTMVRDVAILVRSTAALTKHLNPFAMNEAFAQQYWAVHDQMNLIAHKIGDPELTKQVQDTAYHNGVMFRHPTSTIHIAIEPSGAMHVLSNKNEWLDFSAAELKSFLSVQMAKETESRKEKEAFLESEMSPR